MKQQTVAGFEKYGKTTRRAQSLADMERIIPWPEMTAAVETVYPKISENGGRPPMPLETPPINRVARYTRCHSSPLLNGARILV